MPTVIVQPSTLKSAGQGLFAARDFKRHENVVELTGTFLSEDEFDTLDDPALADYIIEINTVRPSRFLDMRGELAGFANTLSEANLAENKTRRFNVKFVWNKKLGKGFLRARTHIKNEDELFVDYGSHYDLRA